MTFPTRPLNESDAPERIECVCSRHPLLARAGRFGSEPFVWVKNVRSRIEMIVTEGTVRIKCRECNRWHQIRISDRVSVRETFPDQQDSTISV